MERGTADWYRQFAEECKDQSAIFEDWALGIAEDPQIISLIDSLPFQKRQPNLIFAVSRLLGAPVSEFAEFRTWLVSNWQQVSAEAATRSTQTNEPRRCAALIAALGLIEEPISLIEIGASAGLCMQPDRYSYQFGEARLDPVSGPSRLLIESASSSSVPIPSAMPNIAWRAGVDLNPLNVLNDTDVKWLETLVWPEQRDRLERVRLAIEIARLDPPRIIKADALLGLKQLLELAPSESRIVVSTPAVLVYLPYLKRMELVEEIVSRDIDWISLDALRVLPEVDAKLQDPKPFQFTLSMNSNPLANVGAHGQFIEWI
ncbi:MAG: DUF2332 domain-containing protein [Cryobacterium sp.]|nr:DUF2332 domain-containing protein [Cryobacterium sp.]